MRKHEIPSAAERSQLIALLIRRGATRQQAEAWVGPAGRSRASVGQQLAAQLRSRPRATGQKA